MGGITKISFRRSEQALSVSQLELFWLHICIYNQSKNHERTGTRSRPALDGVPKSKFLGTHLDSFEAN
jgi:hypothetical protein